MPADTSALPKSLLPRKATLVAIVVSKWNPRKTDKEVTAKTTRQHQAAADAGVFRKLLIEKSRFDVITQLESAIRKLHYTYTKPWMDDGFRILPNLLHAEFSKKFREMQREFDDAADKFCRHYEFYVREREKNLGSMFNRNDYPAPEKIRAMFSVEVRTMQIPDATDFRSEGLDSDTIEDIRREVSDTNKKMIASAMRDSITQAVTLVHHMSVKLKTFSVGNDDGKRSFFQDSLVENIRELADLLPSFNLTNDPAFDKLAERIKKELCVEDAKSLRSDDKVRQTVAKSADDILKEVSSLLG